MICGPLLCLIAIASSQVQQPKSNYQRVIEQPDPTNGYLDYVRASDLAHSGLLSLCLDWTPKQYGDMLAGKKLALEHSSEFGEWSPEAEANLQAAKKLHGLGFLGAQRVAVEQFGGVLALAREGNRKQVWDPRSKMTPDTVFPEFADFKRIARLFRAEAYVRFADGDSSSGVADLLDGVTFAHKMAGGILIAQLVSVACQSIELAGFEEQLGRLSERDAKSIVSYTDAALLDPSGYAEALRHERDFSISTISWALASPATVLAMTDGVSTQPSGLDAFLKGMSPRETQTVHDGVASTLSDFYATMISKIGRDESTWLDKDKFNLPADPAQVITTDDAISAMVNIVTPVFDQATMAVLRSRAQLRLLDLHARIIDFRWKWGHLPKELRDAVPERLTFDPMSKSTFQYEPKGDTYRLFSKGAGNVGPIELKYRRPPDPQTGDDGPIPPRPFDYRVQP